MKPAVLFVAFRPFDLRLIVDSGVIRHLVDDLAVILLGPSALEETITAMLGDDVRFERLLYQTSKVQGMDDLAEARPGLRDLLRRHVDHSLRLVYGQARGAGENRTGVLHRRTLRKELAVRPPAARLAGYAVLATAWLANRLRPVRGVLQMLYVSLADFRDHRALLDELAPQLVVLPSAGLSIDGWFMAEARHAGIPVVVLSQSWDRTSSKGYPTLPPDHVIVWSNAMRDEVQHYWDVAREKIFVEGAPPWDGHFVTPVTESRDAFLQARGLDPAAKTIYVSLTGPAWHENNKGLADLLLRLRQDVLALHGINLLVRVHPNYLSQVFLPKYRDLMTHLQSLQGESGLAIEVPDVKSIGSTYLVGSRYDSELRALLTYADVMVSVPSSQLIEAAIFDVPYVELNFGRWKNEVVDIDLSAFVLQHFLRLRRHGAGPLCNRPEDLGQLIVEELEHPERRRSARAALAEEEAGTNKGHAAAATAARIHALAASNLASGRVREARR